jgi:hypothetical protein
MTPEMLSAKTYKAFQEEYTAHALPDFTLFWYGGVMEKLKDVGLVIL